MGRYFVERNENEGALGQARVGNFEIRFADAEIVVEENVEVEGAGAVGEAGGAVAAELLFDGQQGVEQLARSEYCFKGDDGVDKAGLRGEADGRGGIERGAADDATKRGKARGCGGQRDVGQAGVAGQVRAHSDVSGVHPLQGIARERRVLEQAQAVHQFREALPVSRSSSVPLSFVWCKSWVVSLLPVLFACVALAGGFGLLQSACRAQGTAPSAAAGENASEPALIPMPRELQAGAVLPLAHGVSIAAPGNDAEDLFTAADLADALKQRGVAAEENGKGEVRIVLLRAATKRAAEILAGKHIEFSAAMHDEGYALVTDGKTVYDIAATAAGVYYGAQTIKQLVVGRAGDAALQGATIRDWPAMKYRGLSDDLSRGPIATLAFQKHEVQVLWNTR